jgi:hypothetical protein
MWVILYYYIKYAKFFIHLLKHKKMTETYVVVHHPCYAPQGHRVYVDTDEYLNEYPSMYLLIQNSLTEQEAHALCDSLNDIEQEMHDSWLEHTFEDSYYD